LGEGEAQRKQDEADNRNDLGRQEAAGFRKIEQRIDEWGIFTVSLAQRVGP
jgi:hypothetical protein